MPEPLSTDQRRVLHVLGFMLFRMGLDERAGRVYAALAATEREDAPDRKAHAALAAVAIRRGDGEKALAELEKAMGGGLSTRGAAMLLMKAQALWIAGRKSEARAAVDEYMYVAGNGERA